MLFRSRLWLSASLNSAVMYSILSTGCQIKSAVITLDPYAPSHAGQRFTVLPPSSSVIEVGTVHIIPMLHFASVGFYDNVLDYIAALGVNGRGVKESSTTDTTLCSAASPTVYVCLEGLCNDDADRLAQEEEYVTIQSSPSFSAQMKTAALDNTTFPRDVQRDILSEMDLIFDEVEPFMSMSARNANIGPKDILRLQECYFKPLLATLPRPVTLKNGDLTLAEAVEEYKSGGGHSGAFGASLGPIGQHPSVKAAREAKCISTVTRLVESHVLTAVVSATSNTERSPGCDTTTRSSAQVHVVVPWGFYHCEPLLQKLFDARSPAQRIAFRPSTAAEETHLGRPLHYSYGFDAALFARSKRS